MDQSDIDFGFTYQETDLQPKQLGKALGMITSSTELGQCYHALPQMYRKGEARLFSRLGAEIQICGPWLLLKSTCKHFHYVNLQEIRGFLERTNTLPGKIAIVQKKLSTASLFLLCNLISSSSERAGAAIPTVPGLGFY